MNRYVSSYSKTSLPAVTAAVFLFSQSGFSQDTAAPEVSPVPAIAPTKSPETDAPIQTETEMQVRLFSIPGPRGLIIDRYGEPLAQTKVAKRCAIRLSAFRSEGDFDTALPKIRSTIDDLVGTDPSIVPPADSELRSHWKNRIHIPFPLSGPLSDGAVGKLEKTATRYPAVDFIRNFVREYPQGADCAHITGYVGLTMPDQHGPFVPEEPLWPGSIGKAGLEASFEDALTGASGKATYLFSENGLTKSMETMAEPEPGNAVVTTLNLKMQSLASKLLNKSEHSGAMVIMDSITGDILAMASNPSFDPNLFTAGISQSDYKSLLAKTDSPLFSRAVSGEFPPGSTFKPFVALAALNRGAVNGTLTRYDCPPFLMIDGRKFSNWHDKPDGYLDVRHALMRSNNVWFYQAGVYTGASPILKTAVDYGFAKAPQLPLESVAAGNLPSEKNSSANQSVANLSIGQGEVLVSPLQLATSMAGIANGTYVPAPRLVIQTQDGSTDEIQERFGQRKQSYLNYRGPDVEIVRQGMWAVVNHQNGTGKAAAMDWPVVLGKSGTAQWSGGGGNRELAWFSGYVDAIEPRIAYAVLIQGNPGETVYGGRNAAPLVGEFVKTVYGNAEAYNVKIPSRRPTGIPSPPATNLTAAPGNVPTVNGEGQTVASPATPTVTTTTPTQTELPSRYAFDSPEPVAVPRPEPEFQRTTPQSRRNILRRVYENLR